MPLLPPTVDGAAVRVIYQALLDARRVEVRYAPRSPDGGGDKTYVASPLGIVARGSISYLVCTLWEYTDIRQLALHRVRAAVISDAHATRPEGFDLDTYIGSGAFEYPIGDPIRLKAIFERGAATHLHETPVSEDQESVQTDEEHVLITATVRDTAQLEWWLLGFAELVEVLEPTALRDRIAASATRMVERYRLRMEEGQRVST